MWRGHLWGQRWGHGTYRDETEVRDRSATGYILASPLHSKMGVQEGEFGMCVPPTPRCSPHPLSVPPKPVNSRSVHIACVLVTATCLSEWRGGS